MVAEAGEVNIDQPIIDQVQHLESVVEPALFKAVPLQTVEQRLNGTGCPVSEIVAAGHTLLLDTVPFQAAGRLSACGGPRLSRF